MDKGMNLCGFRVGYTFFIVSKVNREDKTREMRKGGGDVVDRGL